MPARRSPSPKLVRAGRSCVFSGRSRTSAGLNINPLRMFAKSYASRARTLLRSAPPALVARRLLTREAIGLPRVPPERTWSTFPCTTLMPSCVARLLCRRRAKVARWLSLTDTGSGSRAAKSHRRLELTDAFRSTHRLDDCLDHRDHHRPHPVRCVYHAVGT